MSKDESANEAIELLQQLGLKQYEADCFVGLSRTTAGTAKQVSEITDVPRTRVYDAIRVLEAKGLVETQHTNPQQFRAVPIEEASETLRDQYEDRIARFEQALSTTEAIESEAGDKIQEVWSMTGETAIANRTEELVTGADSEVVLVIGSASLLTEELIETLNALDNTVDLLVGSVTETVQDRVKAAVPEARTFVSGLGWLRDPEESSNVDIGRLLMVDRSAILVSTFVAETGSEHAIFGGGFGNGLVVISRRLMAQGLLPARDPGQK